MLVNQGVKPEEGDLALSAVPCKEDNPEECAFSPWRPFKLSHHLGSHSAASHYTGACTTAWQLLRQPGHLGQHPCCAVPMLWCSRDGSMTWGMQPCGLQVAEPAAPGSDASNSCCEMGSGRRTASESSVLSRILTAPCKCGRSRLSRRRTGFCRTGRLAVFSRADDVLRSRQVGHKCDRVDDNTDGHPGRNSGPGERHASVAEGG